MNALLKVATLIFIFSASSYASQDNLHISFISPNPDSQDFWGITHNFARASAKDLNVDLDVIYSDTNRYAYLDNIRKACASSERPDYLVAVFIRAIAKETLNIVEKCQIPIFMVNTDVPEEDKASIGGIRENYKYYIGHMTPDEEFAGYLLGRQLIQSAKQRAKNRVIEVVGISGRRDGPEAMARNAGLERAAYEQGVTMLQIVFADWNGEKARIQAAELIKRYPNLSAIWAASDHMSIGVKSTIDRLRLEKQVVTGGIDWTKDGINAVQNAQLDSSVGGHFTELGFAIVLLHDHFHGIDFITEYPSTIYTEMHLLSRDNIAQHYNFITQQDWEKIDFSRYSKVLNPALKQYNFSFETLNR